MKPRWIYLGAAAAITAVLISKGGWLVAAMIWNDTFGPKAPPIYREAETTKNGSFDAVVRKHFPRGKPVADMVAELTAQGFKPLTNGAKTCQIGPGALNDSRPVCPDWDAHWNPDNQLEYRWTRGPCGYTLDIRWSADQSGRLKSIEGSDYDACL
jgi:hypothetical protein